MNGLKMLASQLALQHVLNKTDLIPGSTKGGWALTALSAFCAASGGAIGLYATYEWLKMTYAPHMAAAYMGAGLIACSLLFFCAHCGLSYWQRRRWIRMKEDVLSQLEKFTKDAETQLGSPIRENPITTLLLSMIIGFVAGKKI